MKGSAVESPSDERLMESFQHGDHQAFEILLRRHQGGVYRFMLRFSGNRDTAAELTQEAWLRVVAARASFERRSKFTTWLYTIARHLCIDHHRRQQHRRTLSLEGPENPGREDSMAPIDRLSDPAPAPDERADARRTARLVAGAIEALAPEQKEVLLLREEGLPFEEIARVVGVPVNTVKSRMRYALQKLRAQLQTQGVEI